MIDHSDPDMNSYVFNQAVDIYRHFCDWAGYVFQWPEYLISWEQNGVISLAASAEYGLYVIAQVDLGMQQVIYAPF